MNIIIYFNQCSRKCYGKIIMLLTLYWAQDGRLFTSCRAENFKMEDQKWACVLNMEYQWNACMDLNAINCKMCRNEFERDLSDLSMFFYSGFHIYPGECQSHTHKTKSLFFYTWKFQFIYIITRCTATQLSHCCPKMLGKASVFAEIDLAHITSIARLNCTTCRSTGLVLSAQHACSFPAIKLDKFVGRNIVSVHSLVFPLCSLLLPWRKSTNQLICQIKAEVQECIARLWFHQHRLVKQDECIVDACIKHETHQVPPVLVRLLDCRVVPSHLVSCVDTTHMFIVEPHHCRTWHNQSVWRRSHRGTPSSPWEQFVDSRLTSLLSCQILASIPSFWNTKCCPFASFLWCFIASGRPMRFVRTVAHAYVFSCRSPVMRATDEKKLSKYRWWYLPRKGLASFMTTSCPSPLCVPSCLLPQ